MEKRSKINTLSPIHEVLKSSYAFTNLSKLLDSGIETLNSQWTLSSACISHIPWLKSKQAADLLILRWHFPHSLTYS